MAPLSQYGGNTRPIRPIVVKIHCQRLLIGRVNGQFNRMRMPGVRRAAGMCTAHTHVEFTQFFYGNLERVEEGERDILRNVKIRPYARLGHGETIRRTCYYRVRIMCTRIVMRHFPPGVRVTSSLTFVLLSIIHSSMWSSSLPCFIASNK